MATVEEVQRELEHASANAMDTITKLATVNEDVTAIQGEISKIVSDLDDIIAQIAAYGGDTGRAEMARQGAEDLRNWLTATENPVRDTQGVLSQFRHGVYEVQSMVSTIAQQ